MNNLITPEEFFKRAAAIMAAQDRAAQAEARTYRETTPEPTAEQPVERWTNATHHSLGNGCYRVRRQGGAQ